MHIPWFRAHRITGTRNGQVWSLFLTQLVPIQSLFQKKVVPIWSLLGTFFNMPGVVITACPIKGTGGSRSKFYFLVILLANLVYFHPLLTELKNLDPKVPNLANLSGWVEAPEGHFRPFGEIQCPKSQKSVRKCTLMSFK